MLMKLLLLVSAVTVPPFRINVAVPPPLWICWAWSSPPFSTVILPKLPEGLSPRLTMPLTVSLESGSLTSTMPVAPSAVPSRSPAFASRVAVPPPSMFRVPGGVRATDFPYWIMSASEAPACGYG